MTTRTLLHPNGQPVDCVRDGQCHLVAGGEPNDSARGFGPTSHAQRWLASDGTKVFTWDNGGIPKAVTPDGIEWQWITDSAYGQPLPGQPGQWVTAFDAGKARTLRENTHANPEWITMMLTNLETMLAPWADSQYNAGILAGWRELAHHDPR